MFLAKLTFSNCIQYIHIPRSSCFCNNYTCLLIGLLLYYQLLCQPCYSILLAVPPLLLLRVRNQSVISYFGKQGVENVNIFHSLKMQLLLSLGGFDTSSRQNRDKKQETLFELRTQLCIKQATKKIILLCYSEHCRSNTFQHYHVIYTLAHTIDFLRVSFRETSLFQTGVSSLELLH